jgi:hypothetical protein
MRLLYRSPLATYLIRPDLFATVLLAGVTDLFGTECWSWEPETLELELREQGIELDEPSSDRLNALITALTTDRFFNEPAVFGHVAESLVGDPVDLSDSPDVDPEAVAWAVAEVRLNHGTNEDVTFSADVARYVGTVLEDHGLMDAPPGLEFADYPPGVQESASDVLGSDPDLFAAHYGRVQDEKSRISQFVAERVRELLKQLHEIPLNHRDHEQWGKLISRHQQ